MVIFSGDLMVIRGIRFWFMLIYPKRLQFAMLKMAMEIAEKNPAIKWWFSRVL